MTAMGQAMQAAKLKLTPVCPYCQQPAVLVTGAVIYPHRPDLYDKKFWHCQKDQAYVGCHAPNKQFGFTGVEPLGRLANAELRLAKTKAHHWFDPLWKDKHMSRRKAYLWLANQLGIPVESCHIGEFDVAQCEKVAQLSRVKLREVDRG